MVKVIFILAGFVIAMHQVGFAQIGGTQSYEFINVPVNAHIAGIGGANVSVFDSDVNMISQNPALLRDTMRRNLSINYLPYYADIKSTSLAYAFKAGKSGTWAAGLTYFNYGDMIIRDADGTEMGNFKPKDYAFTLTKSHKINNYVLGATIKYVGSKIETYNSLAIMADFGGIFRHPTRDFTIGMVMKNAGFTFNKFTQDSEEIMPFDVQIGSTYKLEHMPLRFSLTAHHLHQFDIVYLDPNKKGKVDIDGNEIKEKKKLGDKIGRHFIIGSEFLLGKNFSVRFGYNHLRRREMRLVTKSGGAGFSFGFNARIKSFEIGYSKAYYHIAGGTNHLTLTTNFNSLLKKKEKKIQE